jgi:nucleotide-binding universal stress UspA family protein
MVRTIVVPLDGTPRSESVLPLAAEIAEAFHTGVTLLSAGWGRPADELEDYHQARAGALGDIEWHSVTAVDTFPADAVRSAADGDGAVVMATRGRRGLAKVVLGSVAEDVLAAVERPLLLLGPHAVVPTSLRGGRLLVALDGEPQSLSVVDHATDLATALGLSVYLVAVTRADGTPLGGRADATELRTRLDTAAERFRAHGLTTHVERIIGGDAAKSLVDLARTRPFDLVAVTTHARTGPARSALGSTAMAVVRDAPCPVLVHHPRVSN